VLKEVSTSGIVRLALPTNLVNRVDRVVRFVDEQQLQRIQRRVLDLVCRPERHYLDVVFYFDFDSQSIHILFHSRTQGEDVFAGPVNRNTAQMIPRFADKLYTQLTLPYRAYVLQERSRINIIIKGK
jgi:hypothetical protein